MLVRSDRYGNQTQEGQGMTVRRWIGTLALGLALAVPLGFAPDASAKDKAEPKTQKTASKTKSTTHKAADKTAKSGEKAGEKGKGTAIETGDTVTDSWITMKIKTDLVNESTLKGSDINVDTKNKIVTLKGTVASEAGKSRAEQIAKDTKGVTKV